LTQFVDDVVRHNQGEESNIIKLALFTMSTKTILNTLLGPITIKKILEVSPPDKLIETFISDLVILKMKLEDKEKAKADAKADAKVEAKDAEPAKKTPQKSTSEKKQKTKNTNQKNKENVQRINSDDHFGIMAAKPKSRKPIYRRKRRETHRYGQNYS